MASVITDIPLPPDVVVFGELGLAGEVRTVPGADRRLAEAQRAGFTRALVPASMAGASAAVPPGLRVHGVRTLAEALSLVHSEAGVQGAPGTMPGWPTAPAAASL
jgi:DNA repair protein RadA/Sms